MSWEWYGQPAQEQEYLYRFWQACCKHPLRVRLMLSEQMLSQWRRPMVSSKALNLNLLHWAMCSVLYQWIAMAIKNGQHRRMYFFAVVLLSVALAATGAIQRANTCLMASSSSIECSPEHVVFGDSHGIVPTHLHGLQNGPVLSTCFGIGNNWFPV
jgi:hypothetical protein